MECNPYLARRIMRLIGADTRGLSYKLASAHEEMLQHIAPSAAAEDAVGEEFRGDLAAEEGPKILADLLEALIGAVALGDDGIEGARRAFGRVVLPPPDIVAELASGKLMVPAGNHGRRF